MATFADLTPEQFKELMRDALSGAHMGGQNVKYGTKSAFGDAADEKARKQMIDDFNKMHVGSDKVVAMLRKQHASYVDISEQLKQFDKAIEEAENSTERIMKQDQKKAFQDAATSANARAALANFGVLTIKAGEGMVAFGKQAASSVGNLTKSLLGGSSGIGFATEMMGASLDMAGAAGTAAGRGMQEAGGALMQMGKRGKAAGVALELMGTATAFAADSMSKFLKFGVEILGKEIEKTVKAFNSMSGAGAVFGRGMDDMIMYSGRAGLTLDQFSNVVKNNAGALAEGGYTVAEGAKIVANVTNHLATQTGKSGLALQKELYNLGYGFEEQANLVADMTSNLKKTGGTASNAQVAQATAEMGKNMRIVADIMGEDAKAKKDAAKKQAEAYAFDVALRKRAKETGDVGLLDRTYQALGMMPASMRTAAIQATVLGGAITDLSANVLGQDDAAREFSNRLMTQVNPSLQDLNAGTARYNDTLVGGTNETGMALSRAAIATGQFTAQANDMGEAQQGAFKNNTENMLRAVQAVAEATARNVGMQRDIVDIETKMQSTQVKIQGMLLASAGNFTTVLDQMIDHMRTIINDATGASTGEEQGFFSKHKRSLMMAGGAALDVAAPFVAAASFGLAAPVAAAMGTVGTGMISGAAAMDGGWSQGGISSGNEKGHQELLHGTELVLPLSADGKSIKMGTQGYTDLSNLLANQTSSSTIQTINTNTVETSQPIDKLIATMQAMMSTSNNNDDLVNALQDLISTAKDQLEKQDDMLRAMNDTKDYTERLYGVMS